MRVSRSTRIGFAYRVAVILLWPFLRTAVRWDIRGTKELTDDDGGIIVAPNHLSWFDPLSVSRKKIQTSPVTRATTMSRAPSRSKSPRQPAC